MAIPRKEVLKMLDGYRMTAFQKDVLVATAQIEKGEVLTYKQVAERIGRPRAYRAVGTALSKNPVAPRIPCHRVVRSDGDTGNYSGKGGRKGKRAMLAGEGAILH